MNRRSFLHASLMAGGLIAVPQFGRWFQRLRRKPVIDLYQSYRVKFGDNGTWESREWVREDGVWRPADPATAYSETGPVVTVSSDNFFGHAFQYDFSGFPSRQYTYFDGVHVRAADRSTLIRIAGG